MPLRAWFIRHTEFLDFSDEDVKGLWTNNQIAIHSMTDSESLDPKAYGRGERTALARFVAFAEEGGFVWAQYRKHKEAKAGLVEPGTKIVIKDAVRTNGKPTRLKVLQMKQVKLIGIGAHKALRAAIPKRVAFSLWAKATKQLQSIVTGTTFDHAWTNLSPAQQEIVCSEFLRSHAVEVLPRLKWLSLPTGGTYPDVDICGLAADGKRLFAQVTYYEKTHPFLAKKVANLLKFKSETPHLLMFCRCDTIEIRDSVIYIPIEGMVFNWLQANPSYASECFSPS